MPRRTEPEPLAAKVGARVRQLRLEQNMSLSDLADASGLSKDRVSGIERGLAAITIQIIERISNGLELPALYVLAFAAEDEHAQVAELVRQLRAAEVTKLRRELTKTTQVAV
jgi:transcriptional regulator with XRE-family HTH domain